MIADVFGLGFELLESAVVERDGLAEQAVLRGEWPAVLGPQFDLELDRPLGLVEGVEQGQGALEVIGCLLVRQPRRSARSRASVVADGLHRASGLDAMTSEARRLPFDDLGKRCRERVDDVGVETAAGSSHQRGRRSVLDQGVFERIPRRIVGMQNAAVNQMLKACVEVFGRYPRDRSK